MARDICQAKKTSLVYDRGLVGGMPSVVITPPGKRVYFGMNLGREGRPAEPYVKVAESELLGLIKALTGCEIEVRT